MPDLWVEAAKVLTDSEKRLLAKLQSEAGIEGSTAIQIDDLIDLTRSKQAECEWKLWKFKIGGREVVLREVAETAISWLNTFKEIGDIAVQFDTTGAALPWAGFRFLVQLAVCDRDQMAGLLQPMERITRTVTRCSIYKSLYSPATTSEDAVKFMRAGIVSIYTAILRTLALSFDLYSKNTAARALHALFTPGKATSLGTRLATIGGELSLEVEMCENMRKASVYYEVEQSQTQLRKLLAGLKDQLSSIDKATSEILRKIGREEQRNILEWFSSLPYSLYHEELRETRTEHTCEWLLKHNKFKEWAESNVSPILWISGFPGSGKTFLVSKSH